jgi:hypothetical protein
VPAFLLSQSKDRSLLLTAEDSVLSPNLSPPGRARLGKTSFRGRSTVYGIPGATFLIFGFPLLFDCGGCTVFGSVVTSSLEQPQMNMERKKAKQTSKRMGFLASVLEEKGTGQRYVPCPRKVRTD